MRATFSVFFDSWWSEARTRRRWLPALKPPVGTREDVRRGASPRVDDAVDEYADRLRIDAGARVGHGDRKGRPARNAARPQPQGRRRDVVDPEAERECARTRARRAVEDDRVLARSRREHGGRGQRLVELVHVRVVVHRQPRVAGQPVLVDGRRRCAARRRCRGRACVITTPAVRDRLRRSGSGTRAPGRSDVVVTPIPRGVSG